DPDAAPLRTGRAGGIRSCIPRPGTRPSGRPTSQLMRRRQTSVHSMLLQRSLFGARRQCMPRIHVVCLLGTVACVAAVATPARAQVGGTIVVTVTDRTTQHALN